MAIVSVSISDELKTKMEELDVINWSAVARNAFANKIKEVDLIKNLTANSKLTEKDVKEISEKIDKKASKKFIKMSG
jgi:hypothetical protein